MNKTCIILQYMIDLGPFSHSTPYASLVPCTVTNGRNIKAKLSIQQQQINMTIVCLQYMV